MSPARWLATVVRWMPADRAEWGAAMMAELEQVNPEERWRFALSCTRVALFPPERGAGGGLVKGTAFTLGMGALLALMLWRPEMGGTWLARVIGFHVWAMLFSKLFLVDFLVLGVLTWSLMKRAKGGTPWARVPVGIRRRARLATEVYFGLLNPVLYLAVLTSGPMMFRLRTDATLGGWIEGLHTAAAALLAAVWGWRFYGPAFTPAPRMARAVLRALLWASLACLAIFALKDLSLLAPKADFTSWAIFPVILLVMSPMYLVPGVLIYDYLRESAKGASSGGSPAGFFLSTDRASRAAIAVAAGLAILTFAFAARRRSEAEVRGLVSQHRGAIHSAAARYDVDARLIAAIVYVTHRDQLSPFRDSIERIFSTAWTIGLPDRSLNRALDLSLGVAQIKPLTAQAGAVLAAGGPKAFRRGDSPD